MNKQNNTYSVSPGLVAMVRKHLRPHQSRQELHHAILNDWGSVSYRQVLRALRAIREGKV